MRAAGPFEVLEILGEGSFGTVCVARVSSDPLRRKVALKILKGAYATNDKILNRTRDEARLLHHTVGDYGVQVDVFRHVTQVAVGLRDVESAPDEIDDAIRACLRHRRPVFIEVPADLAAAHCRAPEPLELDLVPPSDPDALAEAVEEERTRMPPFVWPHPHRPTKPPRPADERAEGEAARALAEACGLALEVLSSVRDRTDANEDSTRAVEDAAQALRTSAQELRSEVQRFQI